MTLYLLDPWPEILAQVTAALNKVYASTLGEKELQSVLVEIAEILIKGSYPDPGTYPVVEVDVRIYHHGTRRMFQTKEE